MGKSIQSHIVQVDETSLEIVSLIWSPIKLSNGFTIPACSRKQALDFVVRSRYLELTPEQIKKLGKRPLPSIKYVESELVYNEQLHSCCVKLLETDVDIILVTPRALAMLNQAFENVGATDGHRVCCPRLYHVSSAYNTVYYANSFITNACEITPEEAGLLPEFNRIFRGGS